MHFGPAVNAGRTAAHGGCGLGGANRPDPTGGEAKGTPRNPATSGWPCVVPKKPEMGPSVVFTTGFCISPADAECSSTNSKNIGPVENNILLKWATGRSGHNNFFLDFFKTKPP